MKDKVINIFNGCIYWSIVLLPFSIAIAPAFTNSFIGLMIFSFLIKKAILRQRLFIKTPLNWIYVFFILAALFSIINSVSYQASLQGIKKLIMNAFIFLICAEEIRDSRHISRIILSMTCGASLVTIDAIWQIIFGRDFIRGNVLQQAIGLVRPTAGFPNPNLMGVYLTAITPVIIGLTLFVYKGKKRVIIGFISCLAILGVYLSLSRGAGLGLYLAILFMSLIRKKEVISIILIAILLLFPFFMPKNIKNYAKDVNYNPAVFMLNQDRIVFWWNTFNMIRHHPFIGVGVNTFSKNYSKYKLAQAEAFYPTQDTTYAHNNFLQMAAEIGLIGLGIFLWFLIQLFKNGFKTYFSLKDNYVKTVSLGILGCLVAFLVNGMTETSLYNSRVAMIFWFLVGLNLAFNKLFYKDERQGN